MTLVQLIRLGRVPVWSTCVYSGTQAEGATVTRRVPLPADHGSMRTSTSKAPIHVMLCIFQWPKRAPWPNPAWWVRVYPPTHKEQEASAYLLTDTTPAYHKAVGLGPALPTSSFLICETGNSASRVGVSSTCSWGKLMKAGVQGGTAGCPRENGPLEIMDSGESSRAQLKGASQT